MGKVINFRLIIVIVFIGIVLRLIHLNQDFWYDEIFSILIAKKYIKVNFYPPLYFYFLKQWLSFLPLNEFFLRLPSVFFNLFTLLPLYKLTKYMYNKKSAILTILLFTFNPFQIWYSQEARWYTLSLLLSTAFFYFYLKIYNQPKMIFQIAAFSCALLWIYTDFISAYFIALFIFTCFIYYRSLPKINLLLLILFIFGIFPTFQFILPKLSFVSQGFWPPTPRAEDIFIPFSNLLLGFTSIKFLYNWAIFFTVILLILKIFHKKEIKEKNFFFFSLFFFSISYLGIFLFSKLFFSIFVSRYFISLSIFAYGIVCYIPKGKQKKSFLENWNFIVIFLLFCLCLNSIYRYYTKQISDQTNYHIGVYIKNDFKQLTKKVLPLANEQNPIFITNVSIFFPVLYYTYKYFPNSYKYIKFAFEPNIIDTNTLRKQGILFKNKKNIFAISSKDIFLYSQENKINKIYLITGDWARNYRLCENSQQIQNALSKDFTLKKIIPHQGLFINIYEHK